MQNNFAAIPGFGGTLNLGKPGLAAGTNAGTIQLVAATNYAINGVMYSKAITNNIAVTASPIQAADTTALYLIAADAAGTITVYKGPDVLNADLAAGNKVLQYSDLVPSTVAVLGEMKVVTVAVTFTAGTTALNAAGVTTTFTDLFQRRPSPLLS